MEPIRTLILALALALVAAAPAAAQSQVVAPPGNSAVQEYTEVIPGAGGDRPAGGKGGSVGQTPAKVLGSRTATALEQLGPDGKAAAAAAAAGAPLPQTRAQRAKGGTLGETAQQQGRSIAAGDSGGRVASIATALAGQGGGMGLLFPLLLGGTLAGAVVLLSARRLSRRG